MHQKNEGFEACRSKQRQEEAEQTNTPRNRENDGDRDHQNNYNTERGRQTKMEGDRHRDEKKKTGTEMVGKDEKNSRVWSLSVMTQSTLSTMSGTLESML